jgi:hypothetical protein
MFKSGPADVKALDIRGAERKKRIDAQLAAQDGTLIDTLIGSRLGADWDQIESRLGTGWE